ncbi:UNVERIFIED_CONTAM: hypothetical protein HDU68_003253 [Siphonaria sp. JEL0065]|nr:hypothetical protein HDU68_003253 [Siphonaria sp. JEL0065]
MQQQHQQQEAFEFFNNQTSSNETDSPQTSSFATFEGLDAATFQHLMAFASSPENQVQLGLGLESIDLTSHSPLVNNQLNNQLHIDTLNMNLNLISDFDSSSAASPVSPEQELMINAMIQHMSPRPFETQFEYASRRMSSASVFSCPGSMMSEYEHTMFNLNSPIIPFSPQVQHMNPQHNNASVSTDFFFHSPSVPVAPWCAEPTSYTTNSFITNEVSVSDLLAAAAEKKEPPMEQVTVLRQSPESPLSDNAQRKPSPKKRARMSPSASAPHDTDNKESPRQRRRKGSNSPDSTFMETTPISTAGTPRRQRNTTATSRPTGGKTFLCPYDDCGKVFPRQYNLKSHMFCHSGARPHACQLCVSTFARKHDLQRHTRTLHATDRPYKCSTCKQGFTQPEQLKRHQIQEKQMAMNGGVLSVAASTSSRKAATQACDDDNDDDYS